MKNYVLNTVHTCRVETEQEALKLREELRHNSVGELVAFSYTIKEIKQKSEVIGTYVVCKIKLEFNKEKEPERMIEVTYEG